MKVVETLKENEGKMWQYSVNTIEYQVDILKNVKSARELWFNFSTSTVN